MLKHSYQQTLNLPKTKFSNRSHLQNTLNKLIPASCEHVYSQQYQELMSKKNKLQRDDVFILHDGPPYANGDIHFGHALNKILKDMINRYQLLFNQKYVWYKPGWDCHGLPIELKALAKLKLNKSDLNPLKIRSIARKHAVKQIDLQIQQFKKLGIMTNWNDRYVTLDPEYEINQLKIFEKLLKNGLIKRQKKPVYWGTETETALAEGELEYNDEHVSKSAYVKFPVVGECLIKREEYMENIATNGISNQAWGKQLTLPENTKLLIWTSTPWTLFSNRAICFNQNFEYFLITRVDDPKHEYLIVEKTLFLMNAKIFDAETYSIVNIIKGSDLSHLKYCNPLYDSPMSKIMPLLHGDHVTNNQGTGLVHTAPGHGPDDYLLGLANGLEIYSPIDDKGNYILSDPKWPAKNLFSKEAHDPANVLDPKTTEIILQSLKDKDCLLHAHDYVHSYPYDWRSKKPVIIRSTPQWFADLSEIKPLALESLQNVKFQPERGFNRLSSFVKSRNEWCISRQRYWGVPIPYFVNKNDSSDILMNSETTSHIIDLIRKKGSDYWFVESSDIEEWLPDGYKHYKDQYVKGKDTVDVWFDSGSSWQVLSFFEKFFSSGKSLSDQAKDLQADMYLEGSDQHRGWFQSSLLTKIGSSLKPVAPYKQIITHGFTLDEKGVKMSKSIGNTIAPMEMIEGNSARQLPALGVDGLRLLVASSNYSTDIVAGPLVMKHVGESLKKFRLTFRFMLGNLNGFDPRNDLLPLNQLRTLDKYILQTTTKMMQECVENYENYSFNKILTLVQYHMNNELSALYFNCIKDSLYSDSPNSLKRKQIQTTLYHVLDIYRSIMAPIIPIMVQEMWDNSPLKLEINDKTSQGSIGMGQCAFTRRPPSLAECLEAVNFETHLDILKKFNKSYLEFISEHKDITKTVKTVAKITCPTALDLNKEELMDLLQVADVELVFGGSTNGAVTVEVSSSPDKECGRCWIHNVKDSSKDLCQRCEDAVNEKKNLSS